ncbi:hypothetical protein VP01_2031g3 [Puccinia sorghi]|uniref:Uncharacterized protein n=1 Tax=Puccinia sorghi TaxID=27349 RepID=A0A0L6VAZ0_9BASI|nr:hypothetical protein VP01_2031g3 [Puccinia sorghi]
MFWHSHCAICTVEVTPRASLDLLHVNCRQLSKFLSGSVLSGSYESSSTSTKIIISSGSGILVVLVVLVVLVLIDNYNIKHAKIGVSHGKFQLFQSQWFKDANFGCLKSFISREKQYVCSQVFLDGNQCGFIEKPQKSRERERDGNREDLEDLSGVSNLDARNYLPLATSFTKIRRKIVKYIILRIMIYNDFCKDYPYTKGPGDEMDGGTILAFTRSLVTCNGSVLLLLSLIEPFGRLQGSLWHIWVYIETCEFRYLHFVSKCVSHACVMYQQFREGDLEISGAGEGGKGGVEEGNLMTCSQSSRRSVMRRRYGVDGGDRGDSPSGGSSRVMGRFMLGRAGDSGGGGKLGRWGVTFLFSGLWLKIGGQQSRKLLFWERDPLVREAQPACVPIVGRRAIIALRRRSKGSLATWCGQQIRMGYLRPSQN